MLNRYALLVTRSPWRTIAVVALVTAAMLPGVTLTTEEPDAIGSFVPDGSDLAQAIEKIQTRFPASGDYSSAQIVARGDVTSPEVIREVIARSALAVAHPEVAPFVSRSDRQPTMSYAHLIVDLSGIPPDRLGPEDIDRVLALTPADDPRAGQLDRWLGDNAGLGQIRLQDNNLDTSPNNATDRRAPPNPRDHENLDTSPNNALLVIDQVIRAGDYGPDASVRTLSNARFQEEAQQALTDSGFLFPTALVVMVAVLWVLFRSPIDTFVTVLGVILTALWQIGLSGYLGPNGLDKINGITPISIIVPVLLVGLTVDYALQIVARRREENDDDPGRATSRAVAVTGAAIGLGALTTALSFLTNLASPMSPIRDFGILAACGIIAGFFIMTSLIPAARILADRRQLARGRPLRTGPVIESVPGMRGLLGPTVAGCARRPKLTLLAVVALTGAAVVGGFNVDTEFNRDEFLPEDSEVVQDLRLARDEVGGLGTTVAGVIVTDLRNPTASRALVALDDRLRESPGDSGTPTSESNGPAPPGTPASESEEPAAPDGSASESEEPEGPAAPDGSASESEEPEGPAAPDGPKRPEQVVGVAGDTLVSLATRTVPDARTVLTEGSTDDLTELYRQVSQAAPDRFAAVVSLSDPPGDDVTIIPIQAHFGYESEARDLYRATDDLWPDDAPGGFTITGAQINPVVTADAITRSQTTATIITVATALALLTGYFWRTHRRWFLGVITVVPIVVVLMLLLGLMWVLHINYNALTALLTSLTIGIGVDYTIHFTHRYLHERDKGARVPEALAATANSVGGALFGSATTTALGFVVLALAPLLVVSQLGILVAITGILSMLAATTVLPCLLVLADRRIQPKT